MGEDVLAGGDAERAVGIFSQIFDMAPDDAAVDLRPRPRADRGRPGRRGAGRCSTASPRAIAKDPAIARAASALALAEARAGRRRIRVRAALAADPDDHEARYELAGALMAARRPRRRRRPAARDHPPRPRLERRRGAQAAAAADGGGRPGGSLGVGAAPAALGDPVHLMAASPLRVPVFPLAGALLFPRAQLPLHIFEPRYRAMVRDALAGDRLIGMVQPRDRASRRRCSTSAASARSPIARRSTTAASTSSWRASAASASRARSTSTTALSPGRRRPQRLRR